MSKPRNFPNFIDAYLKYAHDDFVPPQFNLWTALSIVAGAMERKVWLPWTDTFSYYPNIYVMLISKPGVGKSTALNKGVGLLVEMNQRANSLNLIPSQVTEAKFIELLGNGKPFNIGTRTIFQNAGYYWASEASNSLRNIYGDFIACLTDFYDCPPLWEKATKKDDKITLNNVCLNLLAGTTFDYLGKLVTDDNIGGGFASRIIYVVHNEKLVRHQKWQLGGNSDAARTDYRKLLVEDLSAIHKLTGPYAATAEFAAAWEEWYPKFEEKRQSHSNEKMQNLLARTNTNLLKVAMLFSAAESDERILTIEHWDQALTVVETIEGEIPNIFRQAKASGDLTKMDNAGQAIISLLEQHKKLSVEEISGKLAMRGAHPKNLGYLIDSMIAGKLARVVSMGSGGRVIELAGDTHNEF